MATKHYKTFLSEMKTSDILLDAQEAVDYFKEELRKMFPQNKFKAHAHVEETIGVSINYAFSDTLWEGSIKTSPTYMMFICGLSDNPHTLVEIDKFTIEYIIIAEELNIKFKPITGKTPQDATKGLVNWFDINKDKIIGAIQ